MPYLKYIDNGQCIDYNFTTGSKSDVWEVSISSGLQCAGDQEYYSNVVRGRMEWLRQ